MNRELFSARNFLIAIVAVACAALIPRAMANPVYGVPLPHCEDSRHDVESTYQNSAVSPNSEILCVCAATASGCPASPASNCAVTGSGLPQIYAVTPAIPVCVYSFGQTNHPAWQNTGKPHAYWAWRIQKPASFGATCAAVQAMGFTITTMTVHHNGTAYPRAGSYAIPGSTYGLGPLRKYGEANINRVLIDSFPLVRMPTPVQRVCRIDVTVKGKSVNTGNNDFLDVFAPSASGLILSNGHWMNGAVLGGRGLNDQSGSWTFNLAIVGGGNMATPLANAMASGLDALDLVVADDSLVTSADFVYSIY